MEIFVEIFSFPQIQRFIRGGSLQQPQSGAVFSERYKNVNNNIKNNNIKKQHKNSNTKRGYVSRELSYSTNRKV